MRREEPHSVRTSTCVRRVIVPSRILAIHFCCMSCLAHDHVWCFARMIDPMQTRLGKLAVDLRLEPVHKNLVVEKVTLTFWGF